MRTARARSARWRATISCKGEHCNLGLYESEVEAARAYDRKAVELFGELAYLNFPEEHGRERRPVAAADPTPLDLRV